MQTTEARRALIERLELFARERPRSYRLKVTALALFGLGYRLVIAFAMFAVPVVLTFAMYPSTWVLFIVVTLLLVFGLTWFRPTEIRGERVTRADAPELFAALEALRTRIRAPRVHEVVLNAEFNAGAAQFPRLGIFGWHKQVLILGIPLMAALSREQLLAVVGHELGHFSRAHGRFGHWIYRVRHSWEKLYASMQDEDSGIGAAVNQFYRWFVPYFGAYSFALARLDEYEADADSALASDSANAAAALAAVHVFGGYLEEDFWPGIRRLALQTPEPPDDVFERLGKALRGIPEDELEGRKLEALQRASDLVDTHPSLSERLLALRMSEVRVRLPAASAGEAFFGERWQGVLQRAGATWRKENTQHWRDHHERAKGHVVRLAELLRHREGERTLPVEIEIARLTQETEGPGRALEHWRRLRSQAPEDPRVTLHYGRALAGLRSTEAFELLEGLAARDPCYASFALEAMKQLALDIGDKQRADRYDTRHHAALQRREAAAALFDASYRDARFDPHGLPEHAVAILASQLQIDGTIAEAYLVRLRPEGATPFRACLLVIRIDPEAMHKLGTDQDAIAARCVVLLESILEPSDLVAVRNFFTTELMDEQVEAALAGIAASCVFAKRSALTAAASSGSPARA
jgi:Zn-dependent protease with chaperone function